MFRFIKSSSAFSCFCDCAGCVMGTRHCHSVACGQ